MKIFCDSKKQDFIERSKSPCKMDKLIQLSSLSNKIKHQGTLGNKYGNMSDRNKFNGINKFQFGNNLSNLGNYNDLREQ